MYLYMHARAYMLYVRIWICIYLRLCMTMSVFTVAHLCNGMYDHAWQRINCYVDRNACVNVMYEWLPMYAHDYA